MRWDSLDSSLPWVAQNDISVEDAAIFHENVILNKRSEVKNPDGADLEGMLEVKMDGLQGSRKGRFQRTDRARVAPGFSGFPFDSPAARSGQASLPWVAQNDISVEDAAIARENVILNPSAALRAGSA